MMRKCIMRSVMLLFVHVAAFFACGMAQTVTYPLTIDDASIENAYILHAKNWPSKYGVPQPVLMRSNAGEGLYQIEASRGNFRPTFGNLVNPETGWVRVAEK